MAHQEYFADIQTLSKSATSLTAYTDQSMIMRKLIQSNITK